MSKCPCGEEHSGGNGKYSPHLIPTSIFTGGLSDEQLVGLERIVSCMDRAQLRMEAMANGTDPELSEAYDSLWRLLMGITDAAAHPISMLVADGVNPINAIKGVMAGIGGMMFMAGWEYGKHETSPSDKRRPVQPSREMTADLSEEDDDTARSLLQNVSFDFDSED